MLPKFSVCEDWSSSGDVTIYFEDKISNRVHNHVCNRLSKIFPNMDNDERHIGKLESIVGGIFSNLAASGVLKRDQNNVWHIVDDRKCRKWI